MIRPGRHTRDWSKIDRGSLQIALGTAITLTIVFCAVFLVEERSFLPSAEFGRPPGWGPAAALLDRSGFAAQVDEADNPDAFLGGEDKDGSRETGANVRPLKMRGSPDHPLGTCLSQGRDILEGLIGGARTVFVPGVIAGAVSVLFGGLLGLIEGFAASSWVRAFVGRGNLLLGSLPKFIVILLVQAMIGSQMGLVAFGLTVGVLGIPRVAHMLNSQIALLRSAEFFDACHEMGLSQAQIVMGHVVRGASKGLLLGQFFFSVAEAILLESMMGAVGRTISGFDTASWAGMVAEGFGVIRNGILWIALPPAMAIMLAIAGLLLIGNGLNQRFYQARLE